MPSLNQGQKEMNYKEASGHTGECWKCSCSRSLEEVKQGDGFFVVIVCLFVCCDRVSLCSLHWSGTHASLLASVFWVLGLLAWATMPGRSRLLFCEWMYVCLCHRAMAGVFLLSLFLLLLLFLFIFCVYVTVVGWGGFFAWTYDYCIYMVPRTFEDQNRTLDPLELELEVIAGHYVCAGNWTQVLWKNNQCS